MSEIPEAVHAIIKLNPHPKAHARARWVPTKDKWEFPIIKKPLTQEVAALHVKGQAILGAVASDEEGYTRNVGLDLDAHFAGQNPAIAARAFVRTAQAMNVPIVIHSSKSGKGAHIRTLFSEKIPSFLARAMFIALVLAAGLNGEKAVDKVWPPSHGIGVLALPYNAKCAHAAGGTLALDPNTLRPLPRASQLSAVMDTEEMKRDDVESVLRGMNVYTEAEAAILSGKPRTQGVWNEATKHIKNGTDGGLAEMVRHCHAVARLRDHATEVPYEFWFGMMTNFRPFIGGDQLFSELSRLDSARFDQKVIEKSWKAIAGGPRMCVNLDAGWTCPDLGICAARSPAGLPFAIKRGMKERAAAEAEESGNWGEV